MDEIGTCTIQRSYVGEVGNSPISVRITWADPRIRISRILIDEASRTDAHAFLHLDGDVLTIRDDYGQRFIYRIRWDDYADGGYLAEWPD